MVRWRNAVATLVFLAMVTMGGCISSKGGQNAGGFSTLAPLPKASPLATGGPTPSRVLVNEGEASPTAMFIHLSTDQAPSGN
ncbi:MAG TPA: hypothetical protein VF972_05890, partial [Actinomycetota bacterium]